MFVQYTSMCFHQDCCNKHVSRIVHDEIYYNKVDPKHFWDATESREQ